MYVIVIMIKFLLIFIGELQRKIGIKALEVGGNAIIG